MNSLDIESLKKCFLEILKEGASLKKFYQQK